MHSAAARRLDDRDELDYLKQLNYEIRSADGRILVERI